MVLSNPRLLRTGVSDSQLYSGSWSEPPVAGCRLGTMVRSRQRTRVRRAHSFGCHKHRVRFGLRWTLAISGPRRCTDCGPSCSSRPADPWATENRPGLGELPVKPATQTNAIEQPSPRNYWLSSAELKNRGFATAFSYCRCSSRMRVVYQPLKNIPTSFRYGSGTKVFS